MKFQSRVYGLGVLLLMLFVSAFPVVAQDAPLQGLDDYVNKAIKDWKVPGIAIAVIKDDKIVYAKGYGVRELGKSAPVDENTLFAIGSSSKAFTAASIAMLVDEKKLKWDDSPGKYLPGFELFDPYVTREMTIRDLLTHRIGLERGDILWYASAYDRKEILHRIRYLEPSSSMRSRFGYQNIMYLAAGEIVPSITGKSWDDFVADRIFKPLGMKSSGTSVMTLNKSNNVASPHAEIDDKVRAVAWRDIDNIAPAGSINSNVVDMAQWVRLNLGNGKYADKQLISAASITEMQASQTIIPLRGQMGLYYPKAHFLNYGMGWFLSDYNGRKLVEHGGAIDGMRAHVGMIPEENVGVVILSNLNGAILPTFLGYRIFDAFLGEKPRDWSGEMLKKYSALVAQGKAAAKKAESDRVMGTSPSLALEKYAGEYKSEMYGSANVKFENGKLTAHFGPNFNGKLEHWNYDTFQVNWDDPMQGKGFIAFKLSRKGEAEEMNIAGIDDFKLVPKKKPAPEKK
jgi:CubicO group peptidase (beta-lactamase class C family)